MRVAFRPEARKEALSARDWYEMQVPGLGRHFAHALDEAIAAICRHPLAYPHINADCRRTLLRRFPYSVLFRAGADEVLIVAVFHHSRRPGAWKRRLR